MNKEEIEDEEYESPYCEVCGHCGEIGCCGIRNFITEHIEGKTNCKNESWVISDLIDLCEYKDEVFEQNKQLKDLLDKLFSRITLWKMDDITMDANRILDDLLKTFKGQ